MKYSLYLVAGQIDFLEGLENEFLCFPRCKGVGYLPDWNLPVHVHCHTQSHPTERDKRGLLASRMTGQDETGKVLTVFSGMSWGRHCLPWCCAWSFADPPAIPEVDKRYRFTSFRTLDVLIMPLHRNEWVTRMQSRITSFSSKSTETSYVRFNWSLRNWNFSSEILIEIDLPSTA